MRALFGTSSVGKLPICVAWVFPDRSIGRTRLLQR
jgi:hypothetical protein